MFSEPQYAHYKFVPMNSVWSTILIYIFLPDWIRQIQFCENLNLRSLNKRKLRPAQIGDTIGYCREIHNHDDYYRQRGAIVTIELSRE